MAVDLERVAAAVREILIGVGEDPDRVGLQDTPLLVVCQTGARSASACSQLAKLGFTKTHNLDGGINAWRTAGLPLKKGSKK